MDKWKRDKAFKKIFEAFKRNKQNIRPWEVEALKELYQDENERKGKEYLNHAELFAKLYAYTLSIEAYYFKDVNIANKHICDKLRMPMTDCIALLSKHLAGVKLHHFLETEGFDLNSYKSETELLLEKQNEFINVLTQGHTEWAVAKSLQKTVNELLTNENLYL